MQETQYNLINCKQTSNGGLQGIYNKKNIFLRRQAFFFFIFIDDVVEFGDLFTGATSALGKWLQQIIVLINCVFYIAFKFLCKPIITSRLKIKLNGN